MNKIAVFRTLFGDADNVLPVKEDDKRQADFYLFTDQDVKTDDYSVINVTALGNKRRLSRKYKISVEKYLPMYQYWIYLDASIEMMISPRKAIEKYLNNYSIAVLKHPWRDCVYDEMKECLRIGVSNQALTEAQDRAYKRIGYPEHNGLTENGVLIRRNVPSVIEFNRMWQLLYDLYAERDQFSFCVAAWRLGIKYEMIIDNIRNEPKEFKYYPHLKVV